MRLVTGVIGRCTCSPSRSFSRATPSPRLLSSSSHLPSPASVSPGSSTILRRRLPPPTPRPPTAKYNGVRDSIISAGGFHIQCELNLLCIFSSTDEISRSFYTPPNISQQHLTRRNQIAIGQKLYDSLSFFRCHFLPTMLTCLLPPCLFVI